VDIEVARKPSAILVPSESVRDADTAAPWVLKVEDGRVHRRPVKLGLRSKGWCEVLQGVRPGDQVVPSTAANAATLAEGARVRPAIAAGG
jgi:HlyD family secretion protein